MPWRRTGTLLALINEELNASSPEERKAAQMLCEFLRSARSGVASEGDLMRRAEFDGTVNEVRALIERFAIRTN